MTVYGNGLSILMRFRPGVWTTLPQWLSK